MDRLLQGKADRLADQTIFIFAFFGNLAHGGEGHLTEIQQQLGQLVDALSGDGVIA